MSTVPSGDLAAQGAMLRDDNDYPVQGTGLMLSNSKTLVGTGAAVAVPIFHVTGTVQVLAIWGNITTVLGNNTAAYWRLNDQSAQVSITLSTGTTLTSNPVGSTIVKKGLAAAALTLLDSINGAVSEPTTLETPYFSPFVVVQKTAGVTTDIEFVYTTTDTPTTGVINFYVQYIPIGQGSKLTTA
jgi:hypothetical protein